MLIINGGIDMITRNSVLTTIEKNQEEIKKLGVKRLAVFGSFGRDCQNKNSDVDILVEFRQDDEICSFLTFYSFSCQIFNLF
jgi:predicted nucleotidyltransferase